MSLTAWRALSCFMALRIVWATLDWRRRARMSMKSTTMSPPMSRRRSWRATSSAASMLVLKAVSSWLAPAVALPELTSMAVSASVGSMTRLPPLGSDTVRCWMAAICGSRLWRE